MIRPLTNAGLERLARDLGVGPIQANANADRGFPICGALRGMESWQPTCSLPTGHEGPHRWDVFGQGPLGTDVAMSLEKAEAEKLAPSAFDRPPEPLGTTVRCPADLSVPTDFDCTRCPRWNDCPAATEKE